MENLKDFFLILSTIAGLATSLIAIISILQGVYRPQRTTRVIFLFILSISVLSLFVQEDNNGLALALTQWLGSLVILLLSFKFGMGGRQRSDLLILAIAMLAIVAWQLTDNPVISLCMVLLADFAGLLPTIIKTYSHPYTEDPRFYLSDVLAGGFSILALPSYGFPIIVFPGYVFTINCFMLLLIFFARRRQGGNDTDFP